jgi:hypothetical protein
MAQTETRRLKRLAEELDESGLPAEGSQAFQSMLLEEVDHALRPTVNERRAASSGTILDPKSDPVTWAAGTDLQISRTALRQPTLAASRRFINGLSSWLLRREDEAESEWVLFDRPAGSERDLVILADVLDATIVQRHPSGVALALSVRSGCCAGTGSLGITSRPSGPGSTTCPPERTSAMARC